MNEDVLSIFGKKINSLRRQKNISQEDLADKSDLDRTYISSLENGKRNVSLKALSSLASALEVSLSELFEGI
jgi:transcriptional regulator with XRE-family HTH domain